MDVSESELRAMVRAAITRRGRVETGQTAQQASWQAHSSHGLLPLARGGDGDGACLIEPSVRCNHCGYCLSFGH